VNFLPREKTVISYYYIETVGSLNSSICQVHPTRKMSEVLILHDNARLHTSVYATEAITKFLTDSMLYPPYSPHLAPSKYQLLGH
jgi:hypothetical protein